MKPIWIGLGVFLISYGPILIIKGILKKIKERKKRTRYLLIGHIEYLVPGERIRFFPNAKEFAEKMANTIKKFYEKNE